MCKDYMSLEMASFIIRLWVFYYPQPLADRSFKDIATVPHLTTWFPRKVWMLYKIKRRGKKIECDDVQMI